MAKLKLTKGELKRQRDSLRQFERYLPTLLLKKKQLQVKILEAKKLLDEKEAALSAKENSIEKWVGLLADPMTLMIKVDEDPAKEPKLGDALKKWVIPKEVTTETENIAGANVPLFKSVAFEEAKYDLYTTPFWIDKGIAELQELVSFLVEVKIIRERMSILKNELRITTQRVNLFEKIKIPECMENIRKIRIYLGDQMANAVGISKVAKKKIEAMDKAVAIGV